MDSEQRQAYLESEGTRCPFCDSEELDGEPVTSAAFYDGYESIVKCESCGKAWKDIYTLTDVEEIED